MADIYIEFVSRGNSVKVTAIDADTGLEAAVICPASLPQPDMEKLAVRKLEYVRNKHQSGGHSGGDSGLI